jgi:hypothetical protein
VHLGISLSTAVDVFNSARQSLCLIVDSCVLLVNVTIKHSGCLHGCLHHLQLHIYPCVLTSTAATNPACLLPYLPSIASCLQPIRFECHVHRNLKRGSVELAYFVTKSRHLFQRVVIREPFQCGPSVPRPRPKSVRSSRKKFLAD